MRRRLILIAIFFSFFAMPRMAAQVDAVISENMLRSQVEFLCDSLCAGRGTGTPGGSQAALWVARQMKSMGVLPFEGSYARSFRVGDKVGHNILGMMAGRADSRSDKYIIVAAHYDHVGILNGKAYPGADSNASGVVAMLSIGRMMHAMKSVGRSYPTNVILVAFDGKQLNMEGAQTLWRDIEAGRLHNPITGAAITRDKVVMMANIDMLGSTMSPITKGNDGFVIMLGGLDRHKYALADVKRQYRIPLQLGFDYYGSKDFTKLFYSRISEQKPFVEHGVPSVMFTSGITMATNRLEDTPESLDYAVMASRIRLIYYWIERVAIIR